MIGKLILKHLKKVYMITLITNLKDVKKVFGSITKVFLPILLVLTTCISNGQRLMLGEQILGKQIDYSSYSGKLAKQIQDRMECVILKTDDQDSLLWRQAKLLTWPQYRAMLDSVCCQNQVQMLKKCSPIKSYQYQLTTRFSSNQYKMVWTGQKQNWLTEFQRRDSLGKKWTAMNSLKKLLDSILPLTGKNTGDNSYDGEKLALLVHDEAGKWEKPENILNNWRVTKTTLRLGSRIIGKMYDGINEQCS